MSALLRARKFTYSAYVAWARSACIQTSGVGSRMKSHLDSPGRENHGREKYQEEQRQDSSCQVAQGKARRQERQGHRKGKLQRGLIFGVTSSHSSQIPAR
jgi:hypothetical protein